MFGVRCLLFGVCWLFVLCRVAYGLLCFVRYGPLSVFGCLLCFRLAFGVCRLLFVVCRMLLVVCCCLFVVECSLCRVYCLLYDVRFLLCVRFCVLCVVCCASLGV